MEFEKDDLNQNFGLGMWGKGSILLVEDLPETARAISELLESAGFSAQSVASVKDALNILKNDPPDLIISDLNLPLHSGLDLFHETRSHHNWREIPFVFISGESSEEIRQLGLSLGADSFITKPFQPNDLKAVVEGKLLQSKSRQERERNRFETLKRRIIHTLSHEFRTPLVSITTGTELLLEEYSSLKEEQVQTLLKSILKGGQRLERLVEDFMAMQQIDVGYAARSYDQYKAILPVSEVVDLLQNKTAGLCNGQHLGSTVNFDIDPGVLPLRMEVFPDQFVNAMLRLIDNGLKFSHQEKEVLVKVSKVDQDLVFIIRDWGKGLQNSSLNSEILGQAFEQIDRELNEQQGCGLGLSIASYLLSLHGAECLISAPENDSGTEITIRLKAFG